MRYDVFLSHSHADGDWTRSLFNAISSTDYDGRNVRAWLDERVLDPGVLSSARELETALDRSDRLALVLTPDALASSWVLHELEYFTRRAGAGRVIVLQRREGERPALVEQSECIDWPGDSTEPQCLTRLRDWLRPDAGSSRSYMHGRAVRRAFGSARVSLKEYFSPESTDAGNALLHLMLTPAIDDLDEEGVALAGFRSAGQALAELDDNEGYNMRLLLGEILAEAQLRHARYALVAQEYLRVPSSDSFLTRRNRLLRNKSSPASSAHLPGTVARATSKLAEIDPTRVDLSTLAALLRLLDDRAPLDGPQESVAILVGRTLGKLRGSPLVDALLHALTSWGGDASHVAVAAAVSCTFDERDPMVYTTRIMERRALQAGRTHPVSAPPARIARLLMDAASPLASNPRTSRQIHSAREDYVRAFGTWQPGDGRWEALLAAPAASVLREAPIVGCVRRVSRSNMESRATQLGPDDIAVLTESRIVDALFDGVGAFVIDERLADAPLSVRLRTRGARWATCSGEALAQLEEGTAIVWWPREGDQAAGYSVRPS